MKDFAWKVMLFLIVFYIGFMMGEDAAYDKMIRERIIEDEMLVMCLEEYVKLENSCHKISI